MPGATVTLWARVWNNGSSPLFAGALVYYRLLNDETGSVSVAGLAPGANAWYGLEYTIPSSWIGGLYGYWAQVRDDASTLTPRVGPQRFTLGFVSRFNGSTAPWVAVSGTWSNASNDWFYTPGTLGLGTLSASYATTDFTNVEYRARLWQDTTYSQNTLSCLVIRGEPGTVTDVWESGYEFCWEPENQVFIVYFYQAHLRGLLAYGHSTAINWGAAWNTLRVRAVGRQLTFWINGTELWAGRDSRLSSGRVGISKKGGGGLWVDDVVLTSGGVAPDANELSADTAPDAPPGRKPWW
jgi:hypothetical protein